MSEYFQDALMLLGVGMVTVALILWIVVLVGNGIILFVNRFLPVNEEMVKKATPSGGISDSSKIAAISAAVKIVTGGKGQIISIRK